MLVCSVEEVLVCKKLVADMLADVAAAEIVAAVVGTLEPKQHIGRSDTLKQLAEARD